MRKTINEEVGLLMFYSASKKKFTPHTLHWQNKDYLLGTVDYYHSYMEGQDRQHIFELCDREQTLWFRLKLDSSNLHCSLEAIHDGLTD